MKPWDGYGSPHRSTGHSRLRLVALRLLDADGPGHPDAMYQHYLELWLNEGTPERAGEVRGPQDQIFSENPDPEAYETRLNCYFDLAFGPPVGFQKLCAFGEIHPEFGDCQCTKCRKQRHELNMYKLSGYYR